MMQLLEGERVWASLQQHDLKVGEHYTANAVVDHRKGHLWAQEAVEEDSSLRRHGVSASFYNKCTINSTPLVSPPHLSLTPPLPR